MSEKYLTIVIVVYKNIYFPLFCHLTFMQLQYQSSE